MSKKNQVANRDLAPDPVTNPLSQQPSPSDWTWFFTNAALLSIASLAIGYLWLLGYARAEGIPLRVHGDGVGALVPWIAGTAAALLATPAALLVMTAALMRIPMFTSDASLHDYLRSIEWKGNADPGAMRLRMSFWAFGVPMFIAGSVLILHIASGWVGHAWIWSIVCALAAGSAVFPSLHRRASRVAPALSAGWSYLGISLFVTGLGLGLPVGFARIFGITSDGAAIAILVFGSFIWWMLVSLIAFGKEERLREGVRGLALGSAAIVLLLSSIPDVASNLAATSLRAMGLGGMTVDLRLRAEPPGRASDGLYALVLDTGTQLYLRPCDATSEQRGVDLVAWTSVDSLEQRRKGRCLSSASTP